MKKRLNLIDIMQGLAMFLVVAGHQSVSFAANWYAPLHACIYSFHMGLFVFISGLLIRYTYRPGTPREEYSNVKRKLKKFGLPYLIIGILATLLAHPWHNGLSELLRGGGERPVILSDAKLCHVPLVHLSLDYPLFHFSPVLPAVV